MDKFWLLTQWDNNLGFSLWDPCVCPAVSTDNFHLTSDCVTWAEVPAVSTDQQHCVLLTALFCVHHWILNGIIKLSCVFSSCYLMLLCLVKEEEKKRTLSWFYHLHHMILQLGKLTCQCGYWGDNFDYRGLWVTAVISSLFATLLGKKINFAQGYILLFFRHMISKLNLVRR